MQNFMTSLIFPDLNVWLPLTIVEHPHHERAWAWYQTVRKRELAFCRVTQMGFLRLLTTYSAAGAATRDQKAAWVAYDGWLDRGGVTYLEEPLGIEMEFRFYADRTTPSPKEWGDSYLIAFAAALSMPLVTFDRGLSQRYAGAILLS